MDEPFDVQPALEEGRRRWPGLIEAGRGGPQLIPRPDRVELAGPPPWASAIGGNVRMGIDDVAHRLHGLSIDRSLRMIDGTGHRSAVAIVLNDARDGIEVLLTRRAWHLRTHRGEIAFPGGGEEHGDVFPIGTALREAHEEVALEEPSVETLGALDPMVTVSSNKAVVPVVFGAPDRPRVAPSPDEVDEVLHVSFAELLEPGCYRAEEWTWRRHPGGPGYRHRVHFFELRGDTLWGATASMLNQLFTVLFAPEALDRAVRSAERYGR